MMETFVPLTRGPAAFVPVRGGHWAVIDGEDWARVAAGRWHVRRGSHVGYVKRGPRRWMHRLVLNAGPNQRVDHRNGNGLDNRKANLRFATHTQNMRNARKRSTGTSQYKGVYLRLGNKRRPW